jgi:hypothetical protein
MQWYISINILQIFIDMALGLFFINPFIFAFSFPLFWHILDTLCDFFLFIFAIWLKLLWRLEDKYKLPQHFPDFKTLELNWYPLSLWIIIDHAITLSISYIPPFFLLYIFINTETYLLFPMSFVLYGYFPPFS